MTDARAPSRTMEPKISAHWGAVFLSIALPPHCYRSFNFLFFFFPPPLSFKPLALLLGREKAISNILSWVTATAFSPFSLLADAPRGSILDCGGDKEVADLWGSAFRKQFWALGGLQGFASSCFPFQSVRTQTRTDVDAGRAEGGKEESAQTWQTQLAVWFLAAGQQSEFREARHSLLDGELSGTGVHCGRRLRSVRCREKGSLWVWTDGSVCVLRDDSCSANMTLRRFAGRPWTLQKWGFDPNLFSFKKENV